MLVVIDNDYPEEKTKALYSDVFVHVRTKSYNKHGRDVLVLSHIGEAKEELTYEGISIAHPGSFEDIRERLARLQPTCVLVHFASYRLIKEVILKSDLPFVVWVHGCEALGWYRRLFTVNQGIRAFLKYVKGNIAQLAYFHKLINVSNRTKRIRFAFVSKWMRRITETDCRIRAESAVVIPNPIDNYLFYPEAKSPELCRRILMIRPFGPKKYATDIMTESIIELSKRRVFNELRFTICGSGVKQSKLFNRFQGNSLFEFHEGFNTQRTIKEYHKNNGIFFCLTRQDAQGVSMCEAMSSGLVPLTSDNTAIPEFVTEGVSGLLTDNKPKSAADSLEWLARNWAAFDELSRNASSRIVDKAGIDVVSRLELEFIRMAEKGEKVGRVAR